MSKLFRGRKCQNYLEEGNVKIVYFYRASRRIWPPIKIIPLLFGTPIFFKKNLILQFYNHFINAPWAKEAGPDQEVL